MGTLVLEHLFSFSFDFMNPLAALGLGLSTFLVRFQKMIAYQAMLLGVGKGARTHTDSEGMWPERTDATRSQERTSFPGPGFVCGYQKGRERSFHDANGLPNL